MGRALAAAIMVAACGGPRAAPVPAPAPRAVDAGIEGDDGVELAIHDDDRADAVLTAVWLAIGAGEPITLTVDGHVVCRAQPPDRDELMSLTETRARAEHPGPRIMVVLRAGTIAITQEPGGHVDRIGAPYALDAVVAALPAKTPLFVASEPGVGADVLIAALGPLCKRFAVLRPVLPR
jgi:hypothetical protein